SGEVETCHNEWIGSRLAGFWPVGTSAWHSGETLHIRTAHGIGCRPVTGPPDAWRNRPRPPRTRRSPPAPARADGGSRSLPPSAVHRGRTCRAGDAPAGLRGPRG